MKVDTTEQLCKEIGACLQRINATLGTAESCTAGRVAAAITSIAGSSSYFKGGIICYANDIKKRILGVDATLLERQGPVSEAVVRAMLQGAIATLRTTYVIAITGYAGPEGGKEANAGTIWIAAGTIDNVEIQQINGDKGREKNLAYATLKSLEMLLGILKNHVKTEKR